MLSAGPTKRVGGPGPGDVSGDVVGSCGIRKITEFAGAVELIQSPKRMQGRKASRANQPGFPVLEAALRLLAFSASRLRAEG